MSNVKHEDLLKVNRGGVDYQISAASMSKLLPTDLLLINRNGADYRCTVEDFLNYEPPTGPAPLPPDSNTIYKLIVGSIVEPLDTPDGGYDGGTIFWWRNLSIGSVVPCIFPGAFNWQAATLKILETKTYTIVGNSQTAPSKFEVISGGAGFPSPAENVKLGKGTDDFSMPANLTGVNWLVETL